MTAWIRVDDVFVCVCVCVCVREREREREYGRAEKIREGGGRDKIRTCVTTGEGSNPYNEWHLDTSTPIELLKFGKLQVRMKTQQ